MHHTLEMRTVTAKKLQYKEDEQHNKYPYLDVGAEFHGRISFRLWVSGKLVQKDEDGKDIIRFPLQARIVKTEKGSLVLQPSQEHVVYDFLVPAGYRGDSRFEILAPDTVEVFKYKEYASPRGNLGISEGALVVVPGNAPLKYKWFRSGRLYSSAPEGITILTPDGEEKEIDEVPDGLEALAELPRKEFPP